MTEVVFHNSALPNPKICRAFVTHYSHNVDWSGLTRFAGEIVPMFVGKSIFPDTAEQAERIYVGSTERIISQQSFNPDHDYLVLAGDLLIQAICISVIARKVGGFTVLRFDKRSNNYWPFLIS